MIKKDFHIVHHFFELPVPAGLGVLLPFPPQLDTPPFEPDGPVHPYGEGHEETLQFKLAEGAFDEDPGYILVLEDI